MITNIEDLIIYIHKNQNIFDFSNVSSKDKAVLFSLVSQLSRNLNFTENQANLILRILKDNHKIFETVENFDNLINNPIFKNVFRIIDKSRTISSFNINNRKVISIKFPFDRKTLQYINSICNARVDYHKETKSYITDLTNRNLIKILSNDDLPSYGFTISNELKELHQKILEIENNEDNYLPLIDYDDGYVLKNCHRSLETYFFSNKTENFLSNVLLARSLGLKKGKNIVDKLLSKEVDPRISKIFLKDSNKLYLSNRDYDNSVIASIIRTVDQWPVLIIITDDEEIDKTLENWHSCLENFEIKNHEISVLFRSNNNKSINEYISLQKLNNLVDEKTKVVFIKHKIPKILYKINFLPKIIISSSTFYAHFTTQKLINSHPLVLFHTDQTKALNLSGMEIV
jgi:hypothetical protein